MKLKRKVQLVSVLLFVIFFLCGCIEIDNWKIEYEIEPDLSGKLTHYLQGISVASTGDQEETEDISDIMEEIKTTLVKEIVSTFHMEEIKVEVTQSDRKKFDLKIEGPFNNFLHSLVPLVDAREYNIKKTKKYLHIKFKQIEPSEDYDKMTFSIKYGGKISKNNAHYFNREDGVMQWQMSRVPETGIEFKLYFNEPDFL